MYGQTEATARMSYLPYQKSLEKYGSMGIAIPGGKFTLFDVNGEEITAPDVVGELVYQGANVMLGYAEQGGDLRKGDELSGVLVTGDMAKRDMDGYYYVVGRKKRFLKLFGNRVNLMEVEELLEKQGYLAACVGEDDHLRIYTTSKNTEVVLAFITQVTGINRTAFSVMYIDEIPRNDAGKVLYSELENRV
jgi:acyl-coenzyme A synthetase/AMP-(fatty) acid ligase